MFIKYSLPSSNLFGPACTALAQCLISEDDREYLFRVCLKLKLILLFQALLLAIVGLSYYGNEGTRLFFGLLDYLGVGITVGFSIVIPLIFLSYLCDGNILIFVSGSINNIHQIPVQISIQHIFH